MELIMKKYFAFSDVHGDFTALDQSLKNAGFDAENENHVLFGVGGSQSKEVYEFLVKFQKLGRGFYLLGASAFRRVFDTILGKSCKTYILILEYGFDKI